MEPQRDGQIIRRIQYKVGGLSVTLKLLSLSSAAQDWEDSNWTI